MKSGDRVIDLASGRLGVVLSTGPARGGEVESVLVELDERSSALVQDVDPESDRKYGVQTRRHIIRSATELTKVG